MNSLLNSSFFISLFHCLFILWLIIFIISYNYLVGGTILPLINMTTPTSTPPSTISPIVPHSKSNSTTLGIKCGNLSGGIPLNDLRYLNGNKIGPYQLTTAYSQPLNLRNQFSVWSIFGREMNVSTYISKTWGSNPTLFFQVYPEDDLPSHIATLSKIKSSRPKGFFP